MHTLQSPCSLPWLLFMHHTRKHMQASKHTIFHLFQRYHSVHSLISGLLPLLSNSRRETHRRVVWWVIFKVRVVKSSLTAATLHRVHRVLQEAVGHVCILCNQSFNQSADQSVTFVYISILTHQETNNQIYFPQSKHWEWLQTENEEIKLFKTTLGAQKATGSTTI